MSIRERIAAVREHLRTGDAYGCGACDGFYYTPARLDQHIVVARVTGRHDVPGQRYADRQYRRAARQLRRQGRAAR